MTDDELMQAIVDLNCNYRMETREGNEKLRPILDAFYNRLLDARAERVTSSAREEPIDTARRVLREFSLLYPAARRKLDKLQETEHVILLSPLTAAHQLTPEQAAKLKEQWLSTYPKAKEYLDYIHQHANEMREGPGHTKDIEEIKREYRRVPSSLRSPEHIPRMPTPIHPPSYPERRNSPGEPVQVREARAVPLRVSRALPPLYPARMFPSVSTADEPPAKDKYDDELPETD